jgi:SAM-dependent methyltransferase
MVRRRYRWDGWTDPGEALAVGSFEAEVHGGRVLDLGVGTGRTTTILAGEADAYVGLDSSPAMVREARARHPGADVRVGDARQLDGVPDGSFDVVVFSYNGIDAVDHEDRPRVLREAHRVLRRGGRLLISTLNLEGVAYGESPDTFRAERRPPPAGRLRSIRRRAAVAGMQRLRRRNFRHAVRAARSGSDWAMWPLANHEFRFLVHFTELGAAIRSLREAGFVPEHGWDSAGRPLDLSAEHSDADYVHIVSRRA